MDPVIAIVLILIALIAGAAVGGLLAYKKGVAAGVEQRKRDAEAMVGSAEKQAERKAKRAPRKAQEESTVATTPLEKTTLGDLEALAALKEKLSGK